jgi:hypothetical protein
MNASLPEIFAGGFDRYDGTIQFYQRVNALLQPDFVVVDFGAGRGRIHIDDPIAYRRSLTSLKGKVKECHRRRCRQRRGDQPRDRPCHRDFRSRASIAGSLGRFDPVGFHLRTPRRSQAIARNFERVLKPGGWICARTPNRFGYALANSFLPDSLRSRVPAWRPARAQGGRRVSGVLPAEHAARHQPAVSGAAVQAGFLLLGCLAVLSLRDPLCSGCFRGCTV